MLTSNAFDFFGEISDNFHPYEEAKKMSTNWNNNTDKKSRFFPIWKLLIFSKERPQNPNDTAL